MARNSQFNIQFYNFVNSKRFDRRGRNAYNSSSYEAVAQRRRAGMENRREEFLKTVCQIYKAAVLVVLPLYYIPGNGYDKLGDSKYYLYRNISLICMGICLAVQTIAVVRSCRMENSSSSGMYMRKTGGKIIRWCREHSVVTAVCLYGFCALLSAICSSYGRTA